MIFTLRSHNVALHQVKLRHSTLTPHPTCGRVRLNVGRECDLLLPPVFSHDVAVVLKCWSWVNKFNFITIGREDFFQTLQSHEVFVIPN